MEKTWVKVCLYLLLTVFNVTDVLSTFYTLQHEQGSAEANPITLFLWSHIGIIGALIIKLALPLVWWLTVEFFCRKSRGGKQFISCLVILNNVSSV